MEGEGGFWPGPERESTEGKQVRKYSDGGGTFGHCSALYAQGCGRFSPSRILRTVLMYGRKEADEWI